MSIWEHAMQPGGIEKPPKGLTPEQKAEWFRVTFDDLPDGAFFALADEMGIDLFMDFRAFSDNEGTKDNPDVTDKETP